MTDDTVVKPPDTKTTAAGYQILELLRDGTWSDRGTSNGRDTEQAVRNHAKTNGNTPGTFVAIPRKSWKPVTVKAETVTTLKLEEVKA